MLASKGAKLARMIEVLASFAPLREIILAIPRLTPGVITPSRKCGDSNQKGSHAQALSSQRRSESLGELWALCDYSGNPPADARGVITPYVSAGDSNQEGSDAKALGSQRRSEKSWRALCLCVRSILFVRPQPPRHQTRPLPFRPCSQAGE